MSATAVPADKQNAAAAAPQPWWRVWFAVAGALVVVASLLPPLDTLAQRYVFVETIQFSVFAVIGPALIALGAPWKWLRLSRADTASSTTLADGPFDRLARARGERTSFIRAGVFLLFFMAVTLVWRLPPAMNALVSQPALVALEMATLLVAGTGVWLELLPSPPLTPRLPRPQRAAIAALSMWLIWGIAYAIGLNNGVVFRAYGNLPGRALSLMADQEIAAGIMWVVAALAFIPVVLTTMLSWIGSDNTDEEFQRRLLRDENQRAVVRGWGRPAASRRSF